jgi:hypothetical protein
MRIPVNQIPTAIFEAYNLQELVHNGHVYVEIRKGMYGLPQAGILANKQLLPHLASHGYHPCPHTHGLFTHIERPIAFSLIVDDFGVKYVGKEHAQHLHDALSEKYTITADWSGTLFLGMTLKWDYQNRTVDISMPGYIEKALLRFQHSAPRKREHSPHRYIEPQYGAPIQYTDPVDTSQPLTPTEIKKLMEVIGTFLYYARAVDNTMLVALSTLAAAQTKGTAQTAEACTKLLNYAATHPNAVVRYKASDMILHIHSDASYLSEPQARSRVGGFFFLGNGTENPPLNGALQVISQIMNNVLASAAEAEVGGLFINGQAACPIRTTLTELGHPQPPTIIVTDNECARGIANDTVKQKRSKAIDMRFYWIRDRVAQNQFKICWQKGSDNLADYYTKHHPPAHHQRMRSRYLQQEDSANTATGETATVTFAQQTKFRPQSTLREHQSNQASNRSQNHNNRLKDSIQRSNEYTRNNQPWIEVNNSKKERRTKQATTAPTKNNDLSSSIDLQQNPRQVHTVQSIQKRPRYTEVHCEGVLNNNSTGTSTHTRTYSHPIISSVPSAPHRDTPFPRTQGSNDTSPCLQARLIVRPSTGRYWPKRLVQRPIHIRQ